MGLRNLIRFIDIYGYQIDMKYHGEKTHKTTIGGFMTLATIGILLANVYRAMSIIRSPETDSINAFEVSAALPEGKLFKFKEMNFRVGY